MAVFPGRLSQQLDMQGSLTVNQTKTLADENLGNGDTKSSGTGDSYTKVGSVVTLTDAAATWTSADVGRIVTTASSTTPGNDGSFVISAQGGTTLSYTNSSGATEAFAGTWKVTDPYSLEDDFNFQRTDRKLIKGTTNYYDAVPTYQRPTAVGTDVPSNLTNVAGKTLDAKAEVIDVAQKDIKLRPAITGTDGTVVASDETFTTTYFHFVAGDLNSFVTIVCGGDATADGTYRIKTVTDGQTVELDGLNATGAGGAATWTLLSGVKGILSSRNYASTTNRIGIPIADSGAEDETVYDATYVRMVDPLHEAPPSKNDETPVWGRSFGNAKDTKRTVTNDGVRFFVQLKSGSTNDVSSPDTTLELLSGRSGSAASVTNASKAITGLSDMTAEDVGRYITLYNAGLTGTPGHYKIATFVSATSVTVTAGSNFGTDSQNGSIKWAVSKHPTNWYFYNGDRYRKDQTPETAYRSTPVGGIQTPAEVEQEVADLREFSGADLAQTAPTLTNTGNYFVWSDLLSTSNSNLEELVNEINTQVGDRNYSGSILSDGQTITASLQALSTAIEDSSVVRTIERLAAAVPKDTSHVLPGGISYTVDGTYNGRNMWVYWRGLLKDPGSVGNGDNYEETDTTHITPFEQIQIGDHVNYLILK